MNKKNQLGKMNLNKKVMNIYIVNLFVAMFWYVIILFWRCKGKSFLGYDANNFSSILSISPLCLSIET